MVTPAYLPEAGGVEVHVSQLAPRLTDEFDVTILTSDPSGRLAARDRVDGIDVHRVPAWPRNGDQRVATGIWSAIADHAPDLVHIQCYSTGVAPIGMAAAWRCGIPYVVTPHGGWHSSRIRTALRPVQLQALRPLLRHAARIVAVARFEIEHFRRRLGVGADRFALIPNGAEVATADAATRIRPESLLVASIGRLERFKGHHRVLAAMPALLEREPDARLWIAGRGSFEEALRRQVLELGIDDHVEISAIAPDDRPAMARRLAGVSVAVLMSEGETHPLSVIEAAAAGIPVLVADNSGLAELAEQGVARALPLDAAPEVLAQAILDEYRLPTTRVLPRLPTWDDCAHDHAELYRAVLRERAR